MFQDHEILAISNILESTVNRLSFLWGEEALDGDSTEDIAKRFLALLDDDNGNAGMQNALSQRTLTVSSMFVKETSIPKIVLTGQWLGRTDFHIGQKIIVDVFSKRLVISPSTLETALTPNSEG